MKILVTGAAGQLGSEIKVLSNQYTSSDFIYADSAKLNIADAAAVKQFLSTHQPDLVINCAAFTAVDKAETEKEAAYALNAEAVGVLAKETAGSNTRFVHFSTDFVFDGTLPRPLTEDDKPNPLSVYGTSKAAGDKLCFANNANAIVIRTSWVYSSFGNNFVKTILKLCKERGSINVIYDQIGTPTYARDLAAAVLNIIHQPEWKPGIYNYSNEGVASWYDFAIAIRDLAGLKTEILPIQTNQYPTPAVRPKFSLLNKQKIKATFALQIPYWRQSLQACIQLIK